MNINNSISGFSAYKDAQAAANLQNRKELQRTNQAEQLARQIRTNEKTAVNGISQKNEDKLSDKAKEYLEKLREEYGDYDIMVGNSTDDLKELSKSGNKEYSIIFSSAEIERMANDEKYAGEKMDAVANAISMARRIAEANGYKFSPADENELINKIGVVVDEKGDMKLFAELEKNSAKQHVDDDKLQNTQRRNPYGKEEKPSIKRTTVEAYSAEELLQKIDEIDWEQIPESHPGDRVNYAI